MASSLLLVYLKGIAFFILIFLDLFILFYIYMCFHYMYACALDVYLVHMEGRRGSVIPETRMMHGFELPIEPKSCVRTSANC